MVSASSSVVVVRARSICRIRVGLAAGVTLWLSMTIGGWLMPPLGWVADHYGLSSAMFLLCIAPLFAFALSLTLRETAVLLHPVPQREASQPSAVASQRSW
jgi:MFS transporter, FSR family, fosmidomycin resistance protein